MPVSEHKSLLKDAVCTRSAEANCAVFSRICNSRICNSRYATQEYATQEYATQEYATQSAHLLCDVTSAVRKVLKQSHGRC